MNDYGLTTAMYGLVGAICFFSVIIALILIISYCKVFKKAGKAWWASLVPIYNYVVMIEIAKLPMWYLVLFFVPLANIYVLFKINIEMAKKFGKSAGFGVGMTLLSVIFIPLLAFSDNDYDGVDKDINNSTINNQFDASSIINSANNVVTEESSFNNGISMQSNSNILTEDVSSGVDNIPTESVVEESVNVFEQVPVMEVPTEPVVEESVNAFEQAPVMEMNVPTEPVVEESVNAFNQAPIMEVPTEPVVEESVNAFNQPPITEPNVPFQIQGLEENPISVNEVLETPVEIQPLRDNSDLKKCINCGNELPEIVSVCPNCGTDNE